MTAKPSGTSDIGEPRTTAFEATALQATARAIASRPNKDAPQRVSAEAVTEQLVPRAEKARFAKTLEQVRSELAYLAGQGFLKKHSAANRSLTYSVTAEGSREITALIESGVAPIGESPAHRVWRLRHESGVRQAEAARAAAKDALDRIASVTETATHPDELEHPDDGDRRLIVGVLEDAVDELQGALRILAEPEPTDPR